MTYRCLKVQCNTPHECVQLFVSFFATRHYALGASRTRLLAFTNLSL